MTPTITIQPFQPQDQVEAKALILAGLADHWGILDPTRNPDLNDISATYAHATFLVARLGGRIVGTGALVPRPAETGEIVRMSVAKDLRRQGIGKLILRRLVDAAAEARLRRVILETTATWSEVIAFYRQNGFCITHFVDGDVYFELDLSSSS